MNRLIGTKDFYKKVFKIAIPLMLQSCVTNFVGLLDNLMVGNVGTDQMSGVAIANQFVFIFNLAIFGAVSGAGIFGTQFKGKEDHAGIRNVLRFKLVFTTILSLGCMLLFLFQGQNLIALFLHDGSRESNIELTGRYGMQYMRIMVWGLLPFSIKEAYASTMKENGVTVIPMFASVGALIVNLILNYLLIFGKCGFPILGILGAAIATLIARFAELAIVVIYAHTSKKMMCFKSLYLKFSIPSDLVTKILMRGTPLFFNEILWAIGNVMIQQSYSIRGLDVVAGLSICTTISNLFSIVYFSMGHTTSIMLGCLLGAGKMKEAKDTAAKLMAFSTVICIGVGAVMAVISIWYPDLYNTSDYIKNLARKFIFINSLIVPLNAFTNASYFTLRSGGRTVVTFLFDSVFVWCITFPCAFILIQKTGLPIVTIFAICQSLEMLKCISGYVLVSKGVWIKNIVNEG